MAKLKSDPELLKREGARLLRQILDNHPIVIWALDKKGVTTLSEGKGLAALGLRPGEVVGRSVFKMYRDRPDILDATRRALRGETVRMSVDVDGASFDGTHYPLRDANGRLIGMFGVATDVTDLRQADAELRRKADLLGLLQAVTSAANLAKTSDEAMLATVQKVCALTGWKVGHVYRVPRGGQGRLVPTHLWHLASPAARFARFRRATEATFLRRGVGLPGRVWRTGRPVWIAEARKDPATDSRTRAAKACGIRSGLAFPVLVKDEVAAVLEFFTDKPGVPDGELTAVMANIGTQLGRALERERAEGVLRRSEELLRHLVAGVRDYALYRLDPEGRVASWNEGAARILGYRAEEAAGRRLSAFYTKEDRARRMPQADLTAAAVEGRSEHEGWRLRKDGTRFWANVIITALRDDAGALIGFTHVTRDITERKRLEREILEAGAREQARIGQDLHDSLGQNMTGIALLANALRDRLASRGAAESFDAAKVAAFASVAVQQAKDLARGLIPPELQAQGLAGGLEALAASARELFGIECEVRCSLGRAKPDSVAALHMYRIAQEAVSNAVKHGKARRVLLVVACASGRLTLTVHDDGVGIPPAARRKGGMGLGIMQYRARMMGAGLEVRRGAERGTTIVCSIPLEGA